MLPNEIKTLEEAKQYLRDNYEKGTNCLCCGQRVQRYKRKLNSSMARMLIRLNILSRNAEWVHLRDIIKGISDTGGGDFSKLSYWGLIQEKKNEDDIIKNVLKEVTIDKENGNKIIMEDGKIIIESSGDIELGEGATESLVKGDLLKTLFNSHIHTSPFLGIPTTPPLTPMTAAQLSLVNKTK